MNIEKELLQIEEAIASIRAKQDIISDFKAEFVDGNIICTWTANKSVPMDILYYSIDDNHKEWKHSYFKYVHSIDSLDEKVELTIREPNVWVVKPVQLIAKGGKLAHGIDLAEPVLVEREEVQEPEPTPEEPEPVIHSKLIKIHGEKGDPLQGVNGVIQNNGSVKVYVGQRNGNNLLEFESSDMENWENNGESIFPHGTNIFKGSNGRLHGYRAQASDMNLYLGSQLQNSLGTAYTWRIDGAVNMHETPDGRFRSFGRVRGNDKPKHEGGWGGDVPRYPEAPFNDRRGISYHSSDTWQANWEKNRILADPADYFAGYHEKDVDLVPDFYESIFLPDGRGFVTVFWKRKSRAWVSEDGKKKRLTGEIYPVPALYKNSEITLFPDKTVIPRHYHEHSGIPLVDDKLSIGEIYIGGLMQRGETIYIFYKHRGGIHYESHGKHPSGIYVYQMNKESFDSLFS